MDIPCKYIGDCVNYSPGNVVCDKNKDKSYCGTFRYKEQQAKEHDDMLMKKIIKNDKREKHIKSWILLIGSISWAYLAYLSQYMIYGNYLYCVSLITFMFVFSVFVMSIGGWDK